MDFTDKIVEAFGQVGEIVLVATGHPCLSLLKFPFNGPRVEHEDAESHQETDDVEEHVAFVEGLEIAYEFEEEESPWEGSGTEVTEPEELEGADPARRDEEAEVYSAVLSDSDEMPPLTDSESDGGASSETSDHYREGGHDYHERGVYRR